MQQKKLATIEKGVVAMTTIELTKEETKVLQEILESCLSDLQLESEDITTEGFREELQMKETFVRSMLGRLTGLDVEDFLHYAAKAEAG
jgi:hypothetical protein